MKAEEPSEKKPETLGKAPFSWKSFGIQGAIGLVVNGAIAAGVFSIEVFANPEIDYASTPLRVWGDSLAIAGLLCLLFWALVWVSEEGAFDIIVYGTRKFLAYLFRPHPEQGTLPKTYYDYVMERRAKPRKAFPGFLAISGLIGLAGLILSLISNFTEY